MSVKTFRGEHRLPAAHAIAGWLVVAVLAGAALPVAGVWAAESGEADTAQKLPRYALQLLDDEPLPHRPIKARTADDASRLEALSWYMTGRLLEARADFQGAYAAYRKAAELDPQRLEVLRPLIRLAFRLNRRDEAMSYAHQVVKLDPDDHTLLRQVALYLAGRNELDEAISLLEQAAASPKLGKTSAKYVLLMRDLAVFYSANGQAEKAADAYLVLFEALTDPNKYQLDFRTRARLLNNASETFERIGQAFLDAKRPDKALEAFEQAAKAGGSKPGHLSYHLAGVYLQTGKLEQALSELQKYFDAQLQSQGRRAYERLAEILKKLGRSDELIDRLEKLAEKDPRNATLHYYLADQYVAAGRLKEAEALYRKVLEWAGGADGYLGLVEIYRKQRKAPELLEALLSAIKAGQSTERVEAQMKAIVEDAKLVEALVAAGRKMAAADPPKLDFGGAYLLARMVAEAGQLDAATEFYRVAIAQAPQAAQAGTLYRELGARLLEAEKYAEAAKVFQDAVADNRLPAEKPLFLFFLSQALELDHQTQKALEAVREAKKIRPNLPRLEYQEAWIYYHARQWDKAIPLFQKVIADYPEEKEIVRLCQFSLSNIFVRQGKMREGEAILEQILAEDPDDPSVNNDLGYLYADQGKNLEKAEKMIRKAVEADPDNAAYLDSMGWVLYRLGRYDEAIEWLEKATKLPSGDDATIWDHLGDCYAKRNEPKKAREAWQKALELAEKDSDADAQLIERIKQKLGKKSDSDRKDAKSPADPAATSGRDDSPPESTSPDASPGTPERGKSEQDKTKAPSVTPKR